MNSLPQVRTLLEGRVIASNDASYDEARAVFYGGIDRRPALIVQAKDGSDVSRVVSFARASGLELAVRSGGHSLAGHGVSDGGVVLDLRAMKALSIDRAGRTAWAEAGLTAREYTNAAGVHGLATGFGDTGSVGIGGLTLGGGIGYLVRKHGLTIDDLLAAEVVTADGQLLRVDSDTHPDLFWGIRGGGGNLGVATRFQFRLHEVDTIVGGMLMLPATPEVVSSFVAEAESAREELSTIATVMRAPPMPFLPTDVHGKPIVMAKLVFAGDAEAGEHAIAPFRSLAKPVVDMVKPMRYADIYPPGRADHPVASLRTMFLETIDRSVSDTIAEHLQASTAQMGAIEIRVLGGAMARVSADATAFAHRRSRIMVNIAAMYADPGEAAVQDAWADDFAGALRQGDGGAYVGFLADEGEARVRAAYPGSTWERLAAVKDRYDPSNLFHLNQNVPPSKMDRAATPLRAAAAVER